jgi:flagellar assembly factor FliW
VVVAAAYPSFDVDSVGSHVENPAVRRYDAAGLVEVQEHTNRHVSQQGMLLETTRFGSLQIDPATVITFTQPILGFQEFRRYVLLPGPSEYLTWLQSTDSGELAFILIDPCVLVPDYRVELRPPELAELAVNSASELELYTLVVVPHDQSQVRTNLRAPILVNRKLRLGKQTILDTTDYPIQFFLAKAKEGRPQEKPHARSHA